MASATLTLDQWLFPNGTTVYATPQLFSDEPVVAVVAANSVSFDGLHEDTPYLLRARVAGQLNEVRFRSSLDSLGTSIDARQYGAVGNNSAADNAAIQAALDAAEAQVTAAAAFTGGTPSVTVSLPAGWFKVTGLSIASNVRLRGQGDSTVLLLTGSANANVIQSKNYGSLTVLDRGIVIEDCRIVGNSANQSATCCPQGYVTADTALSPSSTTTLPVDSTAGFDSSGNAWVGNVVASYTGKTTTSLTGVQLVGGTAFTRRRGAWVTPYASKGHLVALQASRCRVRIYGNDAAGSGIYFQGLDSSASSSTICPENVIGDGTRIDTCVRYGVEVGVNATDGWIGDVVLGSMNLAGPLAVRGANWKAGKLHCVGTFDTMPLVPQAILVASDSFRCSSAYFDTFPGTTVVVDSNVNDVSRITGPDIAQGQLYQCCWGAGAGGHGVVFRGRSGITTFARARFSGMEMWAPYAYGFTNAPWTRLVGQQDLTALPSNKLQVTSCLDFAASSDIGGTINTSTDVLTYTGRQMSQTRLSADAAIGDTTLNVKSTTGFDSSGKITLLAFDGNSYAAMTLTYTGKTATTFTGIPSSSTGSITTAASSSGQRGGVAQHFFTGVAGGTINNRADGGSVFAGGQSVTIQARESDTAYQSFQVARHNLGNNDVWTMSNAHSAGKVLRAAGLATIAAAASSVVITHGLGDTPVRENIQLTPTADTQSRRWWVSAVSSTTFTVSLDAAAVTSAITFGWRAEIPL